MLGSRLLRDDAWLPGEGGPGEGQQSIPLRDNVQSTATQALVLIILMMLFARTDAKKQIIPVIGAGSFIATLLAYHFSPTRGGVWYWAGPLVVGVVGYGYAFVSPGAWFLGIPPQSLASAIPLDYAGPGVAGAIVGYWTSRRWQRTHEHADDSPTSTPPQ
jgi:hypothetical protein